MEEFRIALEEDVVPIPIGATGYAASRIHSEVLRIHREAFGGADVEGLLGVPNVLVRDDTIRVDTIFTLIERVQSRL